MDAKYDRIGKQYNQSRKADPYLLNRLFSLLRLGPGQSLLDIGCGSGNYTAALNAKGLRTIGVDPSRHMLDLARQSYPEMKWHQGSAEAIPLPDNSVEGALAFLTTHHWSQAEEGFRELKRVTRPGSRMVVFTATREQMKGYWLCHYFPKMLRDSMQQMPSWKDNLDWLAEAGLSLEETEPYFIRPDLEDWFLYSGKHDPSRYFDPMVRSGISSFSDLANAGEVQKGLARLRSDLEANRFEEAVAPYQSDLGDYLFMVITNPKPA